MEEEAYARTTGTCGLKVNLRARLKAAPVIFMIFKFCAAAQNFLKIELVRQYAAFNAVFCLSVKVKGR